MADWLKMMVLKKVSADSAFSKPNSKSVEKLLCFFMTPTVELCCVCSDFVQIISSELLNIFCSQTWYGGESS